MKNMTRCVEVFLTEYRRECTRAAECLGISEFLSVGENSTHFPCDVTRVAEPPYDYVKVNVSLLCQIASHMDSDESAVWLMREMAKVLGQRDMAKKYMDRYPDGFKFDPLEWALYVHNTRAAAAVVKLLRACPNNKYLDDLRFPAEVLQSIYDNMTMWRILKSSASNYVNMIKSASKGVVLAYSAIALFSWSFPVVTPFVYIAFGVGSGFYLLHEIIMGIDRYICGRRTLKVRGKFDNLLSKEETNESGSV